MEFMTADQINEKLISLTRNERKLTHEIFNHIILFQKVDPTLKLQGDFGDPIINYN